MTSTTTFATQRGSRGKPNLHRIVIRVDTLTGKANHTPEVAKSIKRGEGGRIPNDTRSYVSLDGIRDVVAILFVFFIFSLIIYGAVRRYGGI